MVVLAGIALPNPAPSSSPGKGRTPRRPPPQRAGGRCRPLALLGLMVVLAGIARPTRLGRS